MASTYEVSTTIVVHDAEDVACRGQYVAGMRLYRVPDGRLRVMSFPRDDGEDLLLSEEDALAISEWFKQEFGQ